MVNHKMEALGALFSPLRAEETEMDGLGAGGWRLFHVLIALRTELIKGIKSLANRPLP